MMMISYRRTRISYSDDMYDVASSEETKEVCSDGIISTYLWFMPMRGVADLVSEISRSRRHRGGWLTGLGPTCAMNSGKRGKTVTVSRT